MGFAQGALEAGESLSYWPLKMVSMTVGLAFGIGLSSLWEEWVIASMGSKESGRDSFLIPVFRANYIAFGAVLVILAAIALPKRLGHPNFLYYGRIWGIHSSGPLAGMGNIESDSKVFMSNSRPK